MVDAYRRHRCQAEGIYGEAKGEHGLRRAVRRGIRNMRIQSYLTSAVINLKRLVTHTADLLASLLGPRWTGRGSHRRWAALLSR